MTTWREGSSVAARCRCGGVMRGHVVADLIVCDGCDQENARIVRRVAATLVFIDFAMARTLARAAGVDMRLET